MTISQTQIQGSIHTQFLSFLNEKQREFFFSTLQIIGASLFLAFCAQVSFPLYFSPVPLSGQTLGVMLIGATMGSRKGALSILTYLVEGACGFPVFSMGHFGIATLLGTTGGYLLGFVLQAYLVGWFTERQKSFQMAKTVAFLFLSSIMTLGSGVAWLSSFIGLDSAITAGFLPFILGDIVKSIGVAAYLKVKKQ